MRVAFVCSGRPDNLNYLDNNRDMVDNILSQHGWKVINTPLDAISDFNIALQKYPKNSVEEFLFFYTGHGTYSHFQSIFQLEVDNATIKINDIQEAIFEAINPRKQAIIIDACYSGTLDNLILKRDTEFLFSSQAIEQSYESDELKASIFSYYFCEAIGQNKRFLGEIEKYVQSKNHRQTPLMVSVGDRIEIAHQKIKTEPREHPFVTKLIQKLERERAMVLFSQDFTDIKSYYQAIKRNLKLKFGSNFYKISIPSYADKERYFDSIAKNCNIKEEVKELQDWKDAMQEKLNYSDEVMLFVTNLEEGQDEYNIALAITLRNLYYEYPNLLILFVGRKKLASLVLQNGIYSPLSTLIHHRNRLFFPNELVDIEEEDIVQEFENLLSQKSYLCKLLQNKRIRRFTAWSGDKIINQLFWKNLLIRSDGFLVWRSKELQEIGREVLGC
jgi:hypothetical protein